MCRKKTAAPLLTMEQTQEVMDLLASTSKRKNEEVSDTSDNGEDLTHSSPKIRAVECSAGMHSPRTSQMQFVTITGRERRMTTYNPLFVNKNIIKLIGNYEDLRPLPSGDLLLKCANAKQVSQIIQCDELGDATRKVPVKVDKYSPNNYQSRGVITGVPIDMQDSEILEYLQKYKATFAKRLARKRS